MELKPSVLRLAGQAAHAAVGHADGVAETFEDLSRRMRKGDVEGGLQGLGDALGSLHTFMKFVHLAVQLCDATEAEAAGDLQSYWIELLARLERMEQLLDEADLVALSLLLEHGIARGLRDYRGHAARLSVAFAMAHAA